MKKIPEGIIWTNKKRMGSFAPSVQRWIAMTD